MIAASTSRALLVEDNPVVRAALAGIILRDPELTLVGQAANGESALECHQGAEAARPLSGSCVARYRRFGSVAANPPRSSGPRVVMVSGNATSDVAKQALELGARGLVVNPFNASAVLGAIRAASGRWSRCSRTDQRVS